MNVIHQRIMKCLMLATIALLLVAQAVTADLLSDLLGSNLIDNHDENMHKISKRSVAQCIGRSCTCDASTTNCCPYSACRCNLWKTSCSCVHSDRRWAPACKEIYALH